MLLKAELPEERYHLLLSCCIQQQSRHPSVSLSSSSLSLPFSTSLSLFSFFPPSLPSPLLDHPLLSTPLSLSPLSPLNSTLLSPSPPSPPLLFPVALPEIKVFLCHVWIGHIKYPHDGIRDDLSAVLYLHALNIFTVVLAT